MKLNNTKKIAAMLQASTKKEKKDENVEVLSLKEIANQAAFFQRTFFDDRVKLKKRFKFD